MFMYNIPTKVHFGKGVLEFLGEEIKALGDNVLLVYGGGSIKTNGIYNIIVSKLNEAGIKFSELSGVEPNPRLTTVRKGVEICKTNGCNVVLGVGGGSVIDAAKVIAAGAAPENTTDVWEFVKKRTVVSKVLPIVSVLTISATGSEMDDTAVISNTETNEKLGLHIPLFYPKVSFCDPELTYSVNEFQTACGSADILSHIMEVYFNTNQNLAMIDRCMEGMMKTVIKYAPVALREPNNYEARANLMWTSSWAINGFISGCNKAPWSCHPMEHQLSAVYDITHGLGLAILTPKWMRYVFDVNTAQKFCDFGVNVFGIKPPVTEKEKFIVAELAIRELEKFFYETLNLKSALTEIGIDDTNFELMAEKACGGKDKFINGWKKLTCGDVVKIYKNCL